MPDVQLQSWKVEAELEVLGKLIPVVRFAVSFDLNGIPMATVYLPVGREARSLKPSEVHSTLAILKQETPCKLYVTLTRTFQSAGNLPGLGLKGGGRFLIFEGDIVSTGSSKVQGRAEFVVQAQHVLAGLADSSCFSDSAHPRNPAHYSYGAILPDTGSGLRHLTGVTLASEFVTQVALRADLWGEALYPFLRSLTEADGIFIDEVGLIGSGKNSGSQSALDRLKPAGSFYKPLGLRADLDEDLAAKIMSDVSLTTHNPDSLAAYTLWDLLVGRFAQDYLFSIVPRATGGLVVPFVAGARGIFADITADTYQGVQHQKATPRILRGVGILSGISARTGLLDGGMDTNVASESLGIGGWYEGRETGQVLIQSGPRWMSSLLSSAKYGTQSSGAGLNIRAHADQPGEGQAPATDVRQAVAQRVSVVKSVLNRYAQAIYALEVTKGRQLSLSGPFRLDIAPGSSVRVEGSSETHIAGDMLGLNYVGTVLRVTLHGDAESQQCGSSMHIGYLRTEAENKDDDTSIAEHPLYNETFLGCALVD